MLTPGAYQFRWISVANTVLAQSPVATFAIINPTPTITTLSPASLAAGSAAFTLTVTGAGFVSAATVQVDGSARPTTFRSATTVTAVLPASDVTSVGTHTITVVNPTACVGGVCASNGVTLSITTPPAAPTITTISPSSVTAGGQAFPLTVTGTNFVGTSVVQVNGSTRTTTVGSATSLTATILASDIASSGTPTITVVTPAPGGGTSNSVPLTVVGPSVTAGAATVVPGGQMTFTVANGPGNLLDWVGLDCPATMPDTSPATWKYLSNTQMPPGTGLTAATVTFQAPATVGATCEARLYANNGYIKLATSAAIQVQ